MNQAERSAQSIFEESLTSLMAHTIRAAVNHFRGHLVDLEVWVIADTRDRIHLQAPNKGATSILVSKFVRRKHDLERDRVSGMIYIHKDANKHLARVCIAHEIYHLILELELFLKNSRVAWQKVPTSQQTEESCNLFAARLCAWHDRFNRDDKLREEHVYFPVKLFETVLKTHNTGNHLQWPTGISLSPQNPFYKNPILEGYKLDQ